MLKLTNSFYRYFGYTCGNVNYNRTHVSSFSQLSYTRWTWTCTCIEKNIHKTFCIISHVNSGQQLRLYASSKKKNYQRKLPKHFNETKKFKQMSESLQPTISHVSYGGQFEISSESDDNEHEWNKRLNETGHTSSAQNKESCAIPPDFRVWEQVQKRNDANDGSNFKFKVLSYNVLAQYLLESHPYLYTECASYNLKWKVRAAKLYDEIVKLTPDILCLQEVQASHLETFYAKFEQIGYVGIFKQKTGHRQDGCAIYFKQSLFEMRDSVTIEYYQPELPLLNRDNIGIMVKLKPKCYGVPSIVVATTHLLYNPKRTDVRLAQLQVLLAEIDRFAYYNNGRECGHLPIILTGDFNSTPDSAVIKLLERGCVSASPFRDTSDWQKIGVTDNCQHLSVVLNRQQGLTTDFNMTKIYNSDYRDCVPEPTGTPSPIYSEYNGLFNSGVISQSLNLASTYTMYKPDGCPEATTFQDFWVTVDYIYFSYCSTLRLVERLRLPSASECDILKKLPNDVYGSDHLALAAMFELIPRKSSL